MSAPAILVLGNVNVDLVLGEVDGWPAVGTEIMVERSETRPGGSAGNTALALAGMGVRHRLIAGVGNDPNGAWLISCFDERCCDWIVEAADTTLTVGIVHRGGDRAFFTTPGHLAVARLSDLTDRIPLAPRGGHAIVSGGFLMPAIEAGTVALLEALAAQGWLTAIDPGWPPRGWDDATRATLRGWLARADLVLLNAEEAMAVTGEADADAAATVLTRALRPEQMLVVKKGAAGASAWWGGRRFDVAAPRVQVIDTVGAGDVFNAGLLAALAEGAEPDAALERGVAVAARAISTFPRRYDG